MKIDWAAFVQVGGVIAILVLVGLAACGYESCGKRHEQAATVEEAKADKAHEYLERLKNERDNLHQQVEDLKAVIRQKDALYKAAKAKIPPPTVVVPPVGGERERQLVAEGFAEGLAVAPDAKASILTESDSGLAYLLSQQAKRTASIEAALAACDQLQQAQDATLKAKDLELNKTNEALRASMEESANRQMQALELGRALRIEHGKRWTKYAWGAAGLVVGAYATKH